eukprot:GHVT01006287.1.p1 GENE.GHVT01006287.1~~GHVT01006287.1.p1  ORF type:complete len:236 (-),score=49.70 GHVT01006287.1:1228-1935(-)
MTVEGVVGFVLVLTEYIGPDVPPPNPDDSSVVSQAFHFCPVAGGIVELLDEHERAVRAVWCRRSIPSECASELLRVVLLRLMAHAFHWSHPHQTKMRNSSKLVSLLEVHGLAFPRSAYEFLSTKEGLNLSKHYETPDNGGAHNDTPNQKCKCFKLQDKPNAWLFLGISESRFIKIWNARRETLIPSIPSQTLVQTFARSRARSRSPDRRGGGERDDEEKEEEVSSPKQALAKTRN